MPGGPGDCLSAVALDGRQCVIAAVSGGGDSLALLLLLHDYLSQLSDAPGLLAVTIDHGLRPESAAEARAVADICARHGIAHRTLRWDGAKPETGIAAAAREARLRLLARAAREAGADIVLTGHTADDQAETLAMRANRGSGRGGAGMAPATLYDGRVWFVRPLLGERRAALRVFLGERGIAWIDDPSNADFRFERVRVRAALDDSAAAGLAHDARQMAAAREEEGRQAAVLITRSVRKIVPGLLSVSRSALTRHMEAATFAWRILFSVAGGRSHLPNVTRVEALLARADEEGLHATLSRTVAAGRDGQIYLYRERRNLPRLVVEDGLVWDGRYRIALRRASQALTIGPLGARGAADMDMQEVAAPAGLARAALAAEPALWAGASYLGPACVEPGISLEPVAGPWARLLPCFDLAPANAVLGILGGSKMPLPPLRGHKDESR